MSTPIQEQVVRGAALIAASKAALHAYVLLPDAGRVFNGVDIDLTAGEGRSFMDAPIYPER